MRFEEMRKSVVKQTTMDVPEMRNRNYAEPATPQRISPRIHPNGMELKAGVKHSDLLRPLSNRLSRRANGQTRPRHRLRGTIPPHPIAVIHKAHLIEHDAEVKALKAIRKAIRNASA